MKYFSYSTGTAISLVCLLLVNCSHPTPVADTETTSTGSALPAPFKRTSGTQADSLNGIPGHHFGEPLSAFPGLQEGASNINGMKRYYYPSAGTAHGAGWFGKHAQQLQTSYYFLDDKFAYFITTAHGNNRQLLNEETTYLLGKAGDRFQLDGVIWRGKLARAIYTQPISTSGSAAQLEIASELLDAQLKKQEAARLKVEN